MIDPRPFFAAQDAAYDLEDPANVPGPQVLDVIIGNDTDGASRYGVIWQEVDGTITAAYRGTSDKPEWAEDFDVTPVETRLGQVTAGIWITYGSQSLLSGKLLTAYKVARVVGHSRGGPLAICFSAEFGSTAIVFACPKLVGDDVLAKSKPDCGWHMWGDVIPDLDPDWPSLPLVQRIKPPKGVGFLDVEAHHIWENYKTAINDFYASNP